MRLFLDDIRFCLFKFTGFEVGTRKSEWKELAYNLQEGKNEVSPLDLLSNGRQHLWVL